MNKLIALMALAVLPGVALAGTVVTIPEPSTIALMGLGAVGVLAIALRGRRK